VYTTRQNSTTSGGILVSAFVEETQSNMAQSVVKPENVAIEETQFFVSSRRVLVYCEFNGHPQASEL
jgi:hypothetical protein